MMLLLIDQSMQSTEYTVPGSSFSLGSDILIFLKELWIIFIANLVCTLAPIIVLEGSSFSLPNQDTILVLTFEQGMVAPFIPTVQV